MHKVLIVQVVSILFTCICWALIFKKANQPIWKAFIPFVHQHTVAKIGHCMWTFWVQLIAGVLLIVPMIFSSFLVFANFDAIQSEMYEPEYEEEYVYSDTYSDIVSDEYAEDDVYSDYDDAYPNYSEDSYYDDYNDYDDDWDNADDDYSTALFSGLLVILIAATIFVLPVAIATLVQSICVAIAFGGRWYIILLMVICKPVALFLLAILPQCQYVAGEAFANNDDKYNYGPSEFTIDGEGGTHVPQAEPYAPPVYTPPVNTYNSEIENTYTPGFDTDPTPTAEYKVPQAAQPATRPVMCPNCGTVYQYDGDSMGSKCPGCGRFWNPNFV